MSPSTAAPAARLFHPRFMNASSWCDRQPDRWFRLGKGGSCNAICQELIHLSGRMQVSRRCGVFTDTDDPLEVKMKRLGIVIVTALVAMAASAAAQADGSKDRFAATVASLLAQPYQPAYAPLGLDSAFAPDTVPNTFPAQDYTSGSV